MEGTNTMSAADIAAVTRPNMYGYGDGFGGFGGGNGIWFALLLILGLGGGLGFGRGVDGRVATVDELNSTSNFARLESQVQGIGSSLAQGFRNVDNGLCQIGYQGLQNYANLSKELAGCCCENLRAVDGVKFDMANYAAGIQAAIAAEGQKTRDVLAQNKIESLQAQVSQLQLQNAMCGVVKFPTQYAVPSCNPFAGNGCGC